MPEIEKTIEIARPPAEVFAVLADIEAANAWIPGLKSSQKLTPGPIAAGTKARQVKFLQGKDRPIDLTVATVDPGRKLSFIGTPEGRPPAYIDWHLAAIAGGTLVTERIRFEVPGVMKIITPLIRMGLSGQMEREVAALKLRVERR